MGQRSDLRNYTAADGLSQSQVLVLLQDRDHYLWLGSYGGVSRYDGRRFESLTTENGLRANTVLALAQHPDGGVVVGTSGGGVCSIRQTLGSLEQATVECFEPGGLASNDVRGIWIDLDGTVWAASSVGLFSFSLATGKGLGSFGHEHGLPAIGCRAVVRFKGRLFVGTDAGLFEQVGEQFEAVRERGLGDLGIGALVSSDEGLVVGTPSAVYLLGEDGIETVPLPPVWESVQIHDLATDRSGAIWVATTAGAGRWSGGLFEILSSREGLPGNLVHAITVDHESNVWLGTDFGATKMSPGPFSSYGEEEGLPNAFVRALATDRKGRLWAGTRNGVARFDGHRFQSLPLIGMARPRVYALAEGSDERMWIGTRTGLVRYHNGVERIYGRADGLPSAYVTHLLADPAGGMWIATDRGLARWDRGPEGERIQTLDSVAELTGVFVFTLAYGPEGELWLGRRSGGVDVLRYHSVEGEGGVRIDGYENRFHTELTVWSMDRHGDGSMWVGTNGEGLWRLDGDSRQQMTTRDGLANDFVWQVLCEASGAVWAFTSHGLDRLEGDSLQHFDESDGLPDREGAANTAIEDSRGDLWFGTGSGLARYDPTRVWRNREPPRVMLQQAYVEGMGVLEDGAEIPSKAGALTFRFATLSYREEAKTRFRYRLVGATDSWSAPTPQASITYANLAPGSYRFEVEGANDAGVWSRESAGLAFGVRPAFWQTWAFYSLAALAVVGMIWGGAYLRTRHLQAERRRLGELVTARTQELKHKNESLEREIEERILAEAERSRLEERLRQSEKMEAVGRLAGGVAHDFNNLLTTIAGYGDLVRDNLGESHELTPEVDEILGAAERAARLTQQLLAFSRKQVIAPRILHLNEVVTDITRMLGRLIGEDVDLSTRLGADPDTIRSDRGQLEQVLVNLAINARDAMPEGGQISIRTGLEDIRQPRSGRQDQEIEPGIYITLAVADTGHGMPPEVLDRIFEPFFTTKETGKGTGLGLATVYGIVRQGNGYIDVDSEVDRGTTFTVYLPLVDEAPVELLASGKYPVARPDASTTVLVLEDEGTVRRLVCGVLRRFGYNVIEADGGSRALELARQFEGEIHLLLTDVVMPEWDGPVIAEKLCAERPTLRVLFVSGYPDDYLNKRGMLAEGMSYLSKPFTPKQLIKRVRQILEE